MTKNIEGLTTFQIQERLGIKRNRQKEWIGKYITPTVVADGQGTKNRLSRFDLCKMLLFKTLLDHGFTRDEAGERLDILKPHILKAYGKEIDNVNFVAFIQNSDGKFIDPSLVKPGIKTPFNKKFSDFILAENYTELFEDIIEFDLLEYENDSCTIINFDKIRGSVDKALAE